MQKKYALTEQEAKIVSLKYHGKRISAMNASEVSKWSKALLSKIHVITGWVIPDNDLLIILIDQFEKKLVEDYGNTTPDEIEFAFRSGGTVVKDWGKGMNLNLIDQVMIPYLEKRFEASLVEQSLKEKTKLLPAPEIAVTDKEMVLGAFEVYKLLKNYNLIPLSAYSYLNDECIILLDTGQKAEIKDTIRRIHTMRAKDDFEFANELKACLDYEERLRSECRKYAVAKYFDSLITAEKYPFQ